MSEYSTFSEMQPTEYLCPACGYELRQEDKIEGGWNCRCGEFIPNEMAINSFKGLSNQHRQNSIWR